MANVWILIIMLFAGGTGKAVHTHSVDFRNERSCLEAKAVIEANTEEVGYFVISLTCVRNN